VPHSPQFSCGNVDPHKQRLFMKTLRIELDRGRGWEVRAEGPIPAETSTARIAADLQAYALQYPHRALLDGVEIAHTLPDR
jgi:hypothetical protein